MKENYLKAEMVKKGYNQTKLSKEANVSYATINSIMHGNNNISLRIATKISNILDLSEEARTNIFMPKDKNI